MKLILNFFFALLCANTALAHGGHMATFTYNISSDKIQLEFRIDNSTLDHFELDKVYDNYDLMKALCLSQYINEHTFFHIDQTPISFELESSEQDDHIFIVNMVAYGDFSPSGNYTIENNCFFEYDRRFEHRIIVKKNSVTDRSYRLYKKKNIISIQ